MGKPKFWLPLPQLLSPVGRMSRLQYFIYGLIYFALYFAALLSLDLKGVFKLDGEGNLVDTTVVGMGSYIACQLIFLWCAFALDVKRLHDLNWPGVLAILVLIDLPFDLAVEVARNFIAVPPVLKTVQVVIDAIGKLGGMGVGLFLTFRVGNRGKNKYGPDPLRPPAPPIEVF